MIKSLDKIEFETISVIILCYKQNIVIILINTNF